MGGEWPCGMIVLISDTSVLIDLERAELMEPALALPHKFAVPDALYESELRNYGGAALIALGLQVEALEEDKVAIAAQLRRECLKLSVIDTFALALAQGRGWMLLAGDALLRAEANRRRVECHGSLWIFDEVETSKIVEAARLADCLDRLAAHPRCRLPRREVELRLTRYRS